MLCVLPVSDEEKGRCKCCYYTEHNLLRLNIIIIVSFFYKTKSQYFLSFDNFSYCLTKFIINTVIVLLRKTSSQELEMNSNKVLKGAIEPLLLRIIIVTIIGY